MGSEQTVRNICVLGSTGSIGTQVLNVVERLQGRVRVRSLAGGRNIELLAEQVRRFGPRFVVASDSEGAAALREHPACAGVEVLCGQEGMCRIASDPEVETVVVGVQGFAGLWPTIAAAQAGKQIAIASKEVLVAAKEPVRRAVRKGGAKLIPVDSEHSAIFQCLTGEPEGSVERIILTASGGPFARATREQMASITPAMALTHPTWKMGQKVTIDSATLMNKGLEILEAEALFGVDPQKVDVVIHPRSIVHSLVRFVDGSVKAQLGVPDMRLPIQYALLYPERVDTALPQLDLLTCGPLEFHPPDEERFPCLRLARAAARRGGTIPAVMSAADDVAVEAFLDGRIAFLDIPDIIEDVMERADNEPAEELETIIRADYRAREMAREAVEKRSRAAVR